MPSYGAIITGTGSYAPERLLTNDDLQKLVDTNDEWIVQRTGMKSRHIATPEQATSDLALPAAQRAIENAGLTPNDIDMILVATFTPDYMTPSTACILQHRLGITRSIAAMDLAAACSGFVYALATASQFVRSGTMKHVLVIGAESISKIVDYTDRGTCILFGDGAGAAVLSRCDDPNRGVQFYHLGADGSGEGLLKIPAGGSRTPSSATTVANKQHYLQMAGRDVYKFAVTQMTESLSQAMSACNLTADDVKLVVPHQVNMRIIDSATTKMGFPRDKVYINIERFGNTSAASVPIALDEAHRAGLYGAGDWVIMVAFGAGLTWASVAVKM